MGVRYGRWKIKAGDNQAYAQASYNDADWLSAEGGTDWRFMHNLNPLNDNPIITIIIRFNNVSGIPGSMELHSEKSTPPVGIANT